MRGGTARRVFHADATGCDDDALSSPCLPHTLPATQALNLASLHGSFVLPPDTTGHACKLAVTATMQQRLAELASAATAAWGRPGGAAAAAAKGVVQQPAASRRCCVGPGVQERIAQLSVWHSGSSVHACMFVRSADASDAAVCG